MASDRTKCNLLAITNGSLLSPSDGVRHKSQLLVTSVLATMGGVSSSDFHHMERTLRHENSQLEARLIEATKRHADQLERMAQENEENLRKQQEQREAEAAKQQAIVQDLMKQQDATMKNMTEQHKKALAEMDERSQAKIRELFTIIADLKSSLDEKNARAEELARKLKGVMDAPTQLEIETAMQRLGYEKNCLNLAIAGCSGVGKSSFLNALSGWRNDDPRAAKADYIEGTKEITKYKSRIAGIDIACFDIPGAGTINFSRYEYFKNQGLYIMDALVIVYSDRLTDTDIHLMMHCITFKVPYFLVRTKCDNYFDDSNRDDGIKVDFDREKFQTAVMRQRFQGKKATFQKRVLEEARKYILNAYQKMQKSPPPNITRYVYLVNRESLQKFTSQGKSDVYIMDEERLLRELAQTVASRGK